jgi:hypothetical protein
VLFCAAGALPLCRTFGRPSAQVTGYTPDVEALEHEGRMEEAMLLAGQHVQSELERVRRGRGVVLALQAARATAVAGRALPGGRWGARLPVKAGPSLCTPPVPARPAQVLRNLEDAASAKAQLKYALTIDGKALLYALSPMLRQLFLQVSVRGPAAVQML